MAIIDIIFIVTLLIGFVSGIIGNWWRRLITIIIFVALIVVAYYGYFEYATNWVRYDLLQFLVEKGYISSLSFELAPNFSLRVTNLEDFFILFQNLGFDPIVLKGSCEGLIKALIASVFIALAAVVSEIVSFILYWCLFKWIMPKKIIKGFIPRILGAFLGVGFTFFTCSLTIGLTGCFMGSISETILPAVADANSSLSLLLDKFAYSNGLLNQAELVKYLSYVCGAFDPLFAQSIVVRPIFEILDQMGFSPLQIITVDSINEAGETVKVPFRDNFSAFVNDIVEVGLPKLDSIVANLT